MNFLVMYSFSVFYKPTAFYHLYISYFSDSYGEKGTDPFKV